MSEESYSPTHKKRRQGQHMKARERQQAQEAFLAQYEICANIVTAADEAGIDRSTVYYWQEHDEQFLFAFNRADAAANARIEAEIRSRAMDGWLEPLVSAGKYVTDVRKKSDTLLMFYAKKRMPEYRDKQPDVTVNNNLSGVEVYKVRIPDNGRDDGNSGQTN